MLSPFPCLCGNKTKFKVKYLDIRRLLKCSSRIKAPNRYLVIRNKIIMNLKYYVLKKDLSNSIGEKDQQRHTCFVSCKNPSIILNKPVNFKNIVVQ